MPRIFSSLGSQYSFFDAVESLVQIVLPDRLAKFRLIEFLKARYQVKRVALFYKGRDALECAVATLVKPKQQVITQAFSCKAVEDAIVRAGCVPVYADIGSETNCTLETIAKTFKQCPSAKAIVIQHSLGMPAQIQQIIAWARKNNIFVIEDLAQSIGAHDSEGSELGMHSDAVVFSFGRDKVVDAVSGGAVALRKAVDEKQLAIFEKYCLVNTPSILTIVGDLVYPILTYVIRKTHAFIVGKVLHTFLKKTGFFGSPTVVKYDHPLSMPDQHAGLVLKKYIELEKLQKHRREIAAVYLQQLKGIQNLRILNSPDSIARGSCLRFVVEVSSEQKLTSVIAFCQKKHIYIADRWYRRAVDSSAGDYSSVYRAGSCPEAEKRAILVLNLPTHRQVTVQQAIYIAQQVRLGLSQL